MKYNFDIEKIKYSSDFEIRKIELLKFLEYYFENKRPKDFINYEKELTDFLPEIMSNMSFDELLSHNSKLLSVLLYSYTRRKFFN